MQMPWQAPGKELWEVKGFGHRRWGRWVAFDMNLQDLSNVGGCRLEPRGGRCRGLGCPGEEGGRWGNVGWVRGAAENPPGPGTDKAG